MKIKTIITMQVGSFVAAVYDGEWFVAQVEGEEPENEVEGFTLLNYMEKKGKNQFVWGTKRDKLKTNNRDILTTVDPPIPVNARTFGLHADVVRVVENLFMKNIN